MSDILTPELQQAIDKWVAKYPPEQKRSALSPALMLVQEANGGFLTESLIEAVAQYLEQPAIAAFEVVSFYSMFERKPVGRHKLCICTNVACMLRGSDEAVAHLKKRLGVGLGETTADGKITLKEVECLGACIDAPVMQVGDTYHRRLTDASIDKLLDTLE
ncbi:MAG: NADH-quinone oxidoreductase subunit NuoE [Gammaproteobacteria bacterium]